ncbi:hypothetical protein [Mesorhizobium sp. M1273]|uniref:hypothetical protein n=1 Tax=Mesorhizobium sp. M1273 TaxID=2957075 RepID=UPI0033356492
MIYEGYPESATTTDRPARCHRREQLQRLPALVTRQRQLAAQFDARLRDIAELETPTEPCWTRSNWQSYCVKFPHWFDQRPVCLREGMPYCDTAAMREHLAEISRSADDGAHAVLILIRPDRK